MYRHFVDTGRAPLSEKVALLLEQPPESVRVAFERLAAAHVLVLDPETREVWMAMPFSAVATPFRVTSTSEQWWANCAWDAFGIPAMMVSDADIHTVCGACRRPLLFRVVGGRVTEVAGAVHFAVRPANWWDDIGFT